jgi:uncharacterized protein (DUF2141 family)
MTKHISQFLLMIVPALLFVRCAQQGVLSGGKRDLDPPKLLQSLPALQTINFSNEDIVLKFDEFIQLKDLNNQLVVSPKLKTLPEINVEGKILKIHLKKEELLPNTTYRIYFGQALADIHENNVLQNFQYVFSTGAFIDSLKLEGQVFEAFNNLPAADNIVGLYRLRENADSLPYKEVPDYLVKTDESGKFSFDNLAAQTYKVYAYTDKNKNYLYDGITEKVAFRNSALKLSTDSSVTLKLFQEESKNGFIKRTNMPYYGFLQIILNKKVRSQITPINPRYKENIFETRLNEEKDTVSLFYKNVEDTLGLVLKNPGQSKTDTLRLVVPKKNRQFKKIRNYSLNVSNNVLSLGTNPTIIFPGWMNLQNTDIKKIRLSSKEDSTVNEQLVQGRWLDITHYEITNKLKESVNYKLKIDTAAFFDINGFTNDSTTLTFKTQNKIEFGKVTLKMLFNKKQAYVVQLINDKDQVVREAFFSFSLSSSNAASIEFTDVLPGAYRVKTIFDNNENKKWDTGNMIDKRQPEPLMIHAKQIMILSDWEIEEEILVKE